MKPQRSQSGKRNDTESQNTVNKDEQRKETVPAPVPCIGK